MEVGTAIALASLAVTAAGTGVAVHSALEQGANAEKSANFNRAVANNNAVASQQQAAFDAARIRRRNVLLAGRQRAAIAKSGADDSGSSQDVMFDSSVQGELDAMATMYTGSVASNRDRSAGNLYQMQGQFAQEASLWNAGGTILSGVGQGLGTYSNYLKDQNPTFRGRGRT